LLEYNDGSVEILHLAADAADCCQLPLNAALDLESFDVPLAPGPRFAGAPLVVHRSRSPAAV
jgi:hypothetical protein